ncbi:MAG: hypothetical protein ABIS00_15445 [Gemmatimonadales bacterium]
MLTTLIALYASWYAGQHGYSTGGVRNALSEGVVGFIAGTLAGLIFTSILVRAERGGEVGKLSPLRMILWGAATGLCLAAVMAGIWLLVGTHIGFSNLFAAFKVFGGLGAISAALTIAIARKGALPPPSKPAELGGAFDAGEFTEAWVREATAENTPTRNITPLTILLFIALRSTTSAQTPTIKLTLLARLPAEVANLGNVGSAVVAKDGSLAIADYDVTGIRFYSPTLAATGIFGRSGEGPGEFRNINSLGWVSDTLWVDDYRLRRMTLISSAHQLIRNEPDPVLRLPAVEAGVVFMSGAVSARFLDGSVALEADFVRGSKIPTWGAGHTTNNTPTLRVDASKPRSRVISWESGQGCYAHYDIKGGFGQVDIPFCESSLTGNASDGSVFASVTLGPVTREMKSYHLTATGARGDTIYSRDYVFVPLVIPSRVADSAVQRIRGRLRDNPSALRAFASLPTPYAYEPVRTLLVGAEGTIWLEEWTTGSGHRWLALNAKGDPVGRMELPHNSTLVAADRRSIWVTEENDDGVLGLARFGITWPTTRGSSTP